MNRRALVGAAPAALLVGVPKRNSADLAHSLEPKPNSALSVHPDADLIADCATFAAAYADRQVLNQEARQGPEKWPAERQRDYDRRADPVDDVFWEVVERITTTQATTVAGLLAKLRALGFAVQSAVLVGWEDTIEEHAEFHEKLAMSLARDAEQGVVA